jgi:membrane associated rhomboid family serine protease
MTSRYPDAARGRPLRCGNPQCAKDFVPQLVIDEPADGGSGATTGGASGVPKPATRAAGQWAIPVSPREPSGRPSTPSAVPFATPIAAPMARPIRSTACPRCGKPIEEGMVLCLECGTNIETGRRYLAARTWDKAEEQEQLRGGWLGLWSIFVPFGLIPYASEAPLRRPPIAVLAVILLCFLTFPLGYVEWGKLNLFLWTGDPTVPIPRPPDLPADFQMPPIGRFAWHQLITSQFLHGGVEHLICNLMMLLVVGPKVNDLLGNRNFVLAYSTLGVVSGLAPLLLNRGGHPIAGLGASGSIMGIAGMYLVFAPQPRVRMAFWLRFAVFSPLFLELFRVRGVWLVLVLFGLDVTAIAMGSQDGVGHDVHFTGFTVGALSAAMLVATRLVKCGGYDLLTWLCGQEDVEQDRDAGGDNADEWAGVSNAPVILYPFVAVLLFGIGAVIYRIVQLNAGQ